MPQSEKGALAKKSLLLAPRKVNKLYRLPKTETEDEAVQKAVEESVTNRRVLVP